MTSLINRWAEGTDRQTLLAIVLLILYLAIIAWGLAGIVRGFDRDLALTISLIAFTTGWLAGKHIRKPFNAWVGLSLAGFTTVIVIVGNLGGKVLAFFVAVVTFGEMSDGLSEFPSLARAWTELAGGAVVLFIRVDDWAHAIAGNVPTFDSVATAFAWAVLVWFCASWGGWWFHNATQPFYALLPALVLIVVPYAYSGTEPIILSGNLLCLFTLMVIGTQSARETSWREKGIDFSEEIRFDLALWSIPIIVIIVTLSAAAPSVSIQDIFHWASQVGKTDSSPANTFYDSIGLTANPRPKTAFDPVFSPGLPRNHLIGAGPELARIPVMTIKTNDKVVSTSEKAPRYYWQSSSYDVYFGVGWTTSSTTLLSYPAGAEAIDPPPAFHRQFQQQVREAKSDGLLYAAGDLLTADSKYSVAWRSGNDAFGASVAANTYTAKTWLPVATEVQLRNAGTNYPQAIRDRYLTLPNNIPARVWGFARDLTATEPTPYTRARAIERRLREYPYTLDLPEPPVNRDIVDYFLFDLKRGYCDYYATSFVVLARMAGLPARLAVGYASGQYDFSQSAYLITEADAHSWAQVYFPSYGWIDFEPTGGRSGTDLLGDENMPESHSTGEPVDGDGKGSIFRQTSLWLLVPIIITLVLVGLLAFSFVDHWRLRNLAPRLAVSDVYRRLVGVHVRLNPNARAGDTAYQISAQLRAQLGAMRGSSRLQSEIPGTIQDVECLIETCVYSFYGPDEPDAGQQTRAIGLWEHLRWRLWAVWAWQRISYRGRH